MVHRSTFAVTTLATICLIGCSAPSQTTSLKQQNTNPLVAARYGEDLADTLANLFINKDTIVNDATMRDLIQKKIDAAKTVATDARQAQQNGMMGMFIGIKESVQGYGLLFDHTLFFSSDFETKPGINLHVYLTNAVDPRDTTFPDKTAIDLGEIQSVYGAQQYNLPANASPKNYRTIVLWDTVLKRNYSFAQLSKQGN